MNDSSDIEHNWQNFFSFWTIFCPFTSNPITTQRIKILKRKKKTPGDIIILHKCTIYDNHMIYGSWDMKCYRWNFLSSWAIFFTFYPPLTAQKIKISKKTKKKTTWRYRHLTQVDQKSWSYALLILRYRAWQM